ncbi:MAG TPA: hypothetical protein VI933_01870 [archaeon]|nr:hypothetical protein [archaeon]
MFMERGHCPTCNTEARALKGEQKLFQCGACKTVFSEFGFVQVGGEVEVNLA